MIDAARFYASAGARVFPLRPRSKIPFRGSRGVLEATTDREQVERWWTACPEANIGVATGPALFVLDIDGDEGRASIEALQRQHGALPETLWQRTGGGGWQSLFTAAGGLSNTCRRLGPGLDTRGAGGYVVVPPSMHPSGGTYAWWNDGASIAPLPAWLRGLLSPTSRHAPAAGPIPRPTDTYVRAAVTYVRAAVEHETRAVAAAQPGARNHTLNASTYTLARLLGDHLTIDQLHAAMHAAARACGLPHAEAERTIRSAIAARTGRAS